jgi:hypothetical protein
MTPLFFMALFELSAATLGALTWRHFRTKAARELAEGHGEAARISALLAVLWAVVAGLVLFGAGVTAVLAVGVGSRG